MKRLSTGLSIALTVLAVPALADSYIRPAALTVVLDLRSQPLSYSPAAMEREVGRILEGSGVTLTWRVHDHVPFVADDLVVVRFNGSCSLSARTEYAGDSGPLAITWMSDGRIQPFAEVNCPGVVGAMRRAMWGGDIARVDELLGRALGRVVAHELVHMLTGSAEHSHEGVERSALSGRQLVGPTLLLTSLDLDRLRIALRRR
jgi:hypothetical protein